MNIIALNTKQEQQIIQLPIESIIISKDIYPRSKPDDEAIQRYRDNIDNLPLIQIAFIDGQYMLVDGFHRILAYKLENRTEIEAILRLDLLTPDDVLAESIKLNATHGLQLSRFDKEALAKRLWGKRYTTEQLAKLLAVSEATIKRWTKQVRELQDFECRIQVLALFLAGRTETEIAEEVGIDQATVHRWVDEWQSLDMQKAQMSLLHIQSLATTPPDRSSEEDRAKADIVRRYLGNHLLNPIQPPPSLKVYDVWNFSRCDNHYGADYPGRIPGQIIENLLWYYTKPFDKVYDPFAGSGTTIDVCRAMFRRYWASDIRPYDSTKGIRKHDITQGKPSFFPSNYKMDFIFLDPPYWNMKEDEYPSESISTLSLELYYKAMENIGQICWEITTNKGHLALLIQNQTGAHKGNFEDYLDHIFELYRRYINIGWKPIRRISVPMSPDNNGGANEEKAKKDRRMLGLVRELLVFRKEDTA